MLFDTKTQKELDEENMLPEGEYPFEVFEAEEKISSKGNDMIALTVKVFKEDGQFNYVMDYLMEGAMQYKLLHACAACGLSEKYESGDVSARDFIGKTGMLKLGTQEAKGEWPAKNNIKDYVVEKDDDEEAPVKKKKAAKKKTKATEDLDEDEIPF